MPDPLSLLAGLALLGCGLLALRCSRLADERDQTRWMLRERLRLFEACRKCDLDYATRLAGMNVALQRKLDEATTEASYQTAERWKVRAQALQLENLFLRGRLRRLRGVVSGRVEELHCEGR